MPLNRSLTFQQAVGDAFGIPLAKHPSLRNAVNTLARALDKEGLITLQSSRDEFSASDSKKRTIAQHDRVCLVNAVLLQGVFAEPKTVIKLFTESSLRSRYAAWAKTLLIDQQSIGGQGFFQGELGAFLTQLSGDSDLTVEPLPNPFSETLPQMGIGPGKSTSLLQLLATQAAVLSLGDSMMAYYLNGDLEKAYMAALEIKDETLTLQQYRDLIIRDYHDAKAVAALLDDWR